MPHRSTRSKSCNARRLRTALALVWKLVHDLVLVKSSNSSSQQTTGYWMIEVIHHVWLMILFDVILLLHIGSYHVSFSHCALSTYIYIYVCISVITVITCNVGKTIIPFRLPFPKRWFMTLFFLARDMWWMDVICWISRWARLVRALPGLFCSVRYTELNSVNIKNK